MANCDEEFFLTWEDEIDFNGDEVDERLIFITDFLFLLYLYDCFGAMF